MNLAGEIIPRLFRNEFSRMVAVISKSFGLHYIENAEDIVSETFLLAAETWELRGVPDNPEAWLYTVARNKAYHHVKRDELFKDKISSELKLAQSIASEFPELDFSCENIRDSTLQMMFAVCNPLIVDEAQIGLALRILCGFKIEEIAEAFFTNKETINKRLFRAKEKLRIEKIKMEMPQDQEIRDRLDNVLHIIYLLFNEGYYSTTQNHVLRKGLCLEAMRLGVTLTEFDKTNLPKTNALVAIMCYHSSRFVARLNYNHSPVLYDQQEKELWNRDLINKGDYYLSCSAQGQEITSYHLEARIAAWHTQPDKETEKWKSILQLYDQLLQLNDSPSVALNRAFALFKAKGAQVALEETEKLNLANNHFYFTLLGELYKGIDTTKAKVSFQSAYELAKTEDDRQTLLTKLKAL